MHYLTIMLVDGENLSLRYKSMLQSGRIPLKGNIYEEDCFVWNEQITGGPQKDLVRVSYYTTVVGDDERVKKVKELVAESPFEYSTLSGLEFQGTLVPYVFKKLKNGAKTKSVDINLTIDALRYAYGDSIQQIIVVTGDGDYIPLLREIMARGKMVQVWALSDGLNPDIKHNVDDLMLLDDLFFEPLVVAE